MRVNIIFYIYCLMSFGSRTIRCLIVKKKKKLPTNKL